MTEHRGRGCIYSLQYHIAWCTKKRKKVLSHDIAASIKDSIIQTALENKFLVLVDEVREDYVHLLVDCSPQHYIPDIIKVLKGVSARHAFKVHPGLRDVLEGDNLWNPSYYAGTPSYSVSGQIERFIASQEV